MAATRGNLPLVSYASQPSVRARRASRFEDAAPVSTLITPVAADPTRGGRRSSIALAQAVTAGTTPLEALLSLVLEALAVGDWSCASDNISALNRIASNAVRASQSKGGDTAALNAPEETGSRYAGRTELTGAAREVVVTMGAAGAVSVLARSLALGRSNRELVLRTLWCALVLLDAPRNRQLFLEARGLEALRNVQEQHMWDALLMRTSVDVQVLMHEFLWAETRPCGGAAQPPAGSVASEAGGVTRDGEAPPAGTAPPHPRCVVLCACGRTGGTPLYCDTLAASCSTCSGLPTSTLSALSHVHKACFGDAAHRRAAQATATVEPESLSGAPK